MHSQCLRAPLGARTTFSLARSTANGQSRVVPRRYHPPLCFFLVFPSRRLAPRLSNATRAEEGGTYTVPPSSSFFSCFPPSPARSSPLLRDLVARAPLGARAASSRARSTSNGQRRGVPRRYHPPLCFFSCFPLSPARFPPLQRDLVARAPLGARAASSPARSTANGQRRGGTYPVPPSSSFFSCFPLSPARSSPLQHDFAHSLCSMTHFIFSVFDPYWTENGCYCLDIVLFFIIFYT